MTKFQFSLVFCLCTFSLFGQHYFPKNDGVKTKNTNYRALTSAKIYVTPTQVIENATILIKDGKVVSTGTSVKIPENTNVLNVEGKTIYPSFIDMFTSHSYKIGKNFSP